MIQLEGLTLTIKRAVSEAFVKVEPLAVPLRLGHG